MTCWIIGLHQAEDANETDTCLNEHEQLILLLNQIP